MDKKEIERKIEAIQFLKETLKGVEGELDNINRNLKRSLDTPNEVKKKPVIEKSYLLSTHDGLGLLLMDLDSRDVELIEPKFINSTFTYNSIVSAKDNIYVFGGINNRNKLEGNNRYYKLSMISKRLEIGKINGIEGGSEMAASFDGNNLIYLVNGFCDESGCNKKSVDSFNIQTKVFKKLFTFKSDSNAITFFYRNLLYIFTLKESSIYTLDNSSIPLLLEKENFIKELGENARGACTDNNGYLYIYKIDHSFIKFDLKSHEVIKLATIDKLLKTDIDCNISLNYYSKKFNESYIYFIGGKHFGNYRYSIENNRWIPFFQTDKEDRRYCASIIIKK